MDNKICSKCEEEKSLLEFYFDRSAKGYRSICKSCDIKAKKLRNLLNPDNTREIRKRTYHKNKAYERFKNYEYEKARLISDPVFKLKKTLRCRFRSALRNSSKKGSAIRDLGCSIEFLKEHLQSKFTSEMSWDNHGKVWHIDHIKPLSSFNLAQEEEIKIACHYTNLQPLLISDNLRKGAKYG